MPPRQSKRVKDMLPTSPVGLPCVSGVFNGMPTRQAAVASLGADKFVIGYINAICNA